MRFIIEDEELLLFFSDNVLVFVALEFKIIESSVERNKIQNNERSFLLILISIDKDGY